MEVYTPTQSHFHLAWGLQIVKITPLPSTSPRKASICHLRDLSSLKGSERQKPRKGEKGSKEVREGRRKAKGVGHERGKFCLGYSLLFF